MECFEVPAGRSPVDHAGSLTWRTYADFRALAERSAISKPIGFPDRARARWRGAEVGDAGFAVARGEISTVEIGVEVKIVAKAMLKQIGRVESNLRDQVDHFNRRATTPICAGIVGINRAERYVSYEGKRVWSTDGSGRKHPKQEADETERRMRDALSQEFDELIFLRHRATNEAPYPFAWVDYSETHRDYGAALTRISRAYDQRFGAVQLGT